MIVAKPMIFLFLSSKMKTNGRETALFFIYIKYIYYNKKEKENNLTLINCRPFCRHFTGKTLFITIYHHLHLENKNAYNDR